MDQHEVGQNGWTSMPVDAAVIFGDKAFLTEPEPIALKSMGFPSADPVVAKTLDRVKAALSVETLNHSMRVYYYGIAIMKQQFPEQASVVSPATWALACLLHDIGTADENLTATRMSFDLYGGIKALEMLTGFGATRDQAEAVAEAIIRHQDLGVDGNITFLGQLIQLATIYDNVGAHPKINDFGKLLHRSTRAEINEAFPRMNWCACFAKIVQKEETIKPWCHSTHIVDFDKQVAANSLMKEWE